MSIARLRTLEKRICRKDDGIARAVLTMHPDGSGTDEATGTTYTAAEIEALNQKGSGWLVCIREEIVAAQG